MFRKNRLSEPNGNKWGGMSSRGRLIRTTARDLSPIALDATQQSPTAVLDASRWSSQRTRLSGRKPGRILWLSLPSFNRFLDGTCAMTSREWASVFAFGCTLLALTAISAGSRGESPGRGRNREICPHRARQSGRAAGIANGHRAFCVARGRRERLDGGPDRRGPRRRKGLLREL